MQFTLSPVELVNKSELENAAYILFPETHYIYDFEYSFILNGIGTIVYLTIYIYELNNENKDEEVCVITHDITDYESW